MDPGSSASSGQAQGMGSQQGRESVDGRREDEATRHSTRHVTDRETVSRHRSAIPLRYPVCASDIHLSKACLHPQVSIPVRLMACNFPC